MEKYREYLSELNDMLLRSGVDLELEKQIEEGTLEIPVLVLEQYLEFNKSLAISDSGQAIKVASGTGNMLYNNILYEQLKGEYEETVKNALALLYSEAVDDNLMSEEEKFQARIDAFNEYLQENKELEEEELRVDEEETPSNLVPFDKTQRYTGLTYTVDSVIEGTSQGTDLSYDEINAQNGVGGYDDTVYTEIVEDTDDDLVSDLDTLLEDEEERGTEDTEDFSEDSEDEDYDDSIYTGDEDEDDSLEDSEDEDDSLEDEDFSLEDNDDSSEDADDSLEDDEEDYADYDNLLEDDDTSSEDEDEDYSDYDNLLEDEDSSSEDDDDEDESAFDIPEVETEKEGYSDDDDDDESAFDLPEVDEEDAEDDDEDESAFDLPEVEEEEDSDADGEDDDESAFDIPEVESEDEEDEGYSEDDDDDASLDDYTYQVDDADSEEDGDDEDESAFNLPEVDDDSDDEGDEPDEDGDESSFDLPEVDDDSEEDYDEDFDDPDALDLLPDDESGSGVASPPDPPVPASQSMSKGTKPQIKKDSNDYFADAILGVNDKVIKIPGWFRNKNTQRK